MTALKLIIEPAIKVVTHATSSLTYEDVPLQERPDSCPYLGHVPYFAPKLAKDGKQA